MMKIKYSKLYSQINKFYIHIHKSFIKKKKTIFKSLLESQKFQENVSFYQWN